VSVIRHKLYKFVQRTVQSCILLLDIVCLEFPRGGAKQKGLTHRISLCMDAFNCRHIVRYNVSAVSIQCVYCLSVGSNSIFWPLRQKRKDKPYTRDKICSVYFTMVAYSLGNPFPNMSLYCMCVQFVSCNIGE